MKTSLRNNAYFWYSVIFVVILSLVFLPYLMTGKSFVWNIDGISQHYPSLLYYGELLRGLLAGKGFPMVDFRIGMGFDTIATLHYYVLGDPIALFSIGMTRENGVVFYNALILLRFYLIGISYLLFCGYWNYRGSGRILGALIYTFCGYTFYSGIRHPYFLNPMIYFPILMLGLEEVLRRKKPYLLIGMAFLCTISNFYFLYILTMISVIYVSYRYICCYRREYEKVLKGLVMTGIRTGTFYLIGVGMGAAIFLPVIYAFLQNGRLDSKPELLTGYLYYSRDYYLSSLQGVFASGVSSGYWVDLAFPGIVAVAVTVVLLNRRYRGLRNALVLSLIGLAVPAFGYFMNGFSYVTNRWDFVIAFLVALSFTVAYPHMFQLQKSHKLLIVLGCFGYGCLTFLFHAEKIVRYSFLILIATVCLILLLQVRGWKIGKGLKEGVLYALVIGSLGFNGYAFHSTRFNGYSEEFLTRKQVDTIENGAESSMINSIQDKSFYRIETYGEKVRNEAMVMDFYDVSGYFSLMDGSITDSLKELELCSQRTAYRFDNFDNRTVLDSLAGVKYLVTTKKAAAPYAYELLLEKRWNGQTYYLFQNLFALPLGYTYDTYILREDYELLNPLEKQNALMTGVILEQDSDYAAKSLQNLSIGIEKLDYSIDPGDGIILRDGKLVVTKAGAQLKLTFNNKKKSETYLRLVNTSLAADAITMETPTVKAEMDASKPLNIRSKYHNTYFGKMNFLINTGYSKNNKTWLTLTFPEPTVLYVDKLELYHYSMDYYKQQVHKLRKNSLTNVSLLNNRITGDITMDRKGILVCSIPYSKGWSATVDGKKIKLLKGNGMYLAMELPAGAHHIRLNYVTPWLRAGLILTAFSFLLAVITVLRCEKMSENYSKYE